MGTCKYCGKPAGFFRKKHKECEQKYFAGVEKIKLLINSSLSNNDELKNINKKIKQIASESFISDQEINQLKKEGWELATNSAFEDGVLTEDEENRLIDMIDVFGFDKSQINSEPAYKKIVQGDILRDVLDGKIPEKISVNMNLPFNFYKTEKLVWVFQDVEYYEMRTKREHVGGYQGVSIKIAKGVYYRTGGFKGRVVETTETEHIDNGMMAVTDKYIYFAGSKKSFRIKYEKIVSFTPYSDGIGVQRDAQTAKPQIFVTNEGWFTNNLIQNLAKL